MLDIAQQIATELNVRNQQITATIELIDEGSTVPFIARYRKEVTGNLDDTQLRYLEEKLIYYRELEDRKKTIIESIREQNKLTPELEAQIHACLIKQNIEDIYLPYKPKRRTKAQIAIEHGLEPLAHALWHNPELVPEQEATQYINEHIVDVKAALDGARDILAEQFAETASLLEILRKKMWQNGVLFSQVMDGQEMAQDQKFKDYYDFNEYLDGIPSHRLLAMLRGRNLSVLSLKLDYADLENGQSHPLEDVIAEHMQIQSLGRPADTWLKMVCKWTWRIKLHTSIELELINQARELAEQDAIGIFGNNLKELLLSAPAGAKATMGLDPGIRTGVKVAIVDHTGKLVETSTIYPFPPKNDVHGSLATLEKLAKKHHVELIAIGNGTASRETSQLTAELLKKSEFAHIQKIIVNESGASIYSASELAAKEFPDLDVSLRGAVSIARRLQDPLAELVKIPPESIGVGQYQHDLNSKNLSTALNNVVEDCVNAVGVDVNMASSALLERISGLNATLAKNIVAYRDEHGEFTNRKELRKVARFGDKTFEQAAGFLRIRNGDEPLDASAVHPESYDITYKMLDAFKQKEQKFTKLQELIGNVDLIKQIDIKPFINEKFGKETLSDILKEFEKPGRDPRPDFKTAKLNDSVSEVKDLKVDMLLEGTVTNVTAFGAFVDIGVHQDGLVHISELSNSFVSQAQDIVKAGQIVKVKVLDVDIQRKRIALSMKLGTSNISSNANMNSNSNTNTNMHNKSKNKSDIPHKEEKQHTPAFFAKNTATSNTTKQYSAPQNNAMADAFAKLKGLK
jgi:protein Tex